MKAKKPVTCNCTFTPKAVKYAKSQNSSKRIAVQNIYIAHRVNPLSVLSCSSIHSDWLSGHLHKSLIAICIKLSFWCERTPHLTMSLHGQRLGGTSQSCHTPIYL